MRARERSGACEQGELALAVWSELETNWVIENYRGSSKYALQHINSILVSKPTPTQKRGGSTTSSTACSPSATSGAGASSPTATPSTASATGQGRPAGRSAPARAARTARAARPTLW